jgi:predicted SAM-dependent methyltransferase
MRQRVRNLVRAARRRRLIDVYLHTHAVRKLQLGAGEHPRDGWLNTDLHAYGRGDELVYLDVRKPFPLPDAAFDAVHSEHMLEHLTYAEGQHCLRECLRVLKRSGRIRVATPSLERLAALYDHDLNDVQRRYVRWAVETLAPETGAELPGVVVNNFFHSWGHRFIYDPQTLRHALGEAGFVDIAEVTLGELEQHLPEEPEFNAYETFVLEARRP